MAILAGPLCQASSDSQALKSGRTPKLPGVLALEAR
jgi:hypothetical protein